MLKATIVWSVNSGAEFNSGNGCKRYCVILCRWLYCSRNFNRSVVMLVHLVLDPFFLGTLLLFWCVFLGLFRAYEDSSLHTGEYISMLSNSSKQINDIICQSDLSTKCSLNCREAFLAWFLGFFIFWFKFNQSTFLLYVTKLKSLWTVLR